MHTSLDKLVTLMLRARREHLFRKAAVREFQALVWEGLDPSISEGVRDVLRELAHDLDDFEPDARCERKIRATTDMNASNGRSMRPFASCTL